jgi:acyl-CoA reductase-like NAD-dependent aldehyde dehydrogenase
MRERATQWIGGKAFSSHDRNTISIRDPADESVFAEVPRGCVADADAALAAARQAQHPWAALSPSDRAKQLRIGLEKIHQNRDKIAEVLTRENGKPLAHARAEVDLAGHWSNSLIELGVNLSGRSVGAASGELLFQIHEPRGVAVCLSTWNAPVVAAVEMIVANLIVGNTVVLKTSERAPLATRMALELFDALPAGALNVLSGDGPNVGEPLVRHEETDVVCFIGSAGVGRRIGQATGERIRKVILELGGKNALIIDDAVDPVAAARMAAPSCFANTGQICTCTERIYVLRRIHNAFVEHLSRIAAALNVGPGLDPATEIGPMIADDIRGRVEQHVNAAVASGAQAVVGGKRLDRKGYFYPPTVLTAVSDAMPIMQEETFGPIAPVVSVDSFDGAIELANRTAFGLSTIVYTESAPRAIQAIHQLNTGMIKINTARGQIPHCTAEPAKDSGVGFGHGIEFLQELTYRKAVHWRARL